MINPSPTSASTAPSLFRSKQEQIKLSKKLSSALRHRAVEMGLEMSPDGFVKMTDLLRHRQFAGYSAAQVEACVSLCEKRRFELKQEGESNEVLIRATQGHSMSFVEDDQLLERILDPSEIPVCFHGTYAQHIPSIRRSGLNRMKRNNIHLIARLPEKEAEVVSGMRKSADTIVLVDVKKAIDAGIPFYRSSNGVVLSPGLGVTGCIPPEFIQDIFARSTHSTHSVPSSLVCESSYDDKKDSKQSAAYACTSSINGYSHYCVIDFEATCLSDKPIRPQEIIEFPAVMLCARSLKVVEEFHSYVRPVRNGILSDFCIGLTGITQQQVKNAPVFRDVFNQFTSFLETFKDKHRVDGESPSILFVTHGDWDLKTMLPIQCNLSKIKLPVELKEWMNVKVLFSETNCKSDKGLGMKAMMHSLNLELVGRHHSGIDDSRNIARIVVELIGRGGLPRITSNSFNSKKKKSF